MEDVLSAATRPTWRERVPGPWQTPQIRLAHVSRMLDRAVAAEAEGTAGRADFYFNTAHDELERLGGHAETNRQLLQTHVRLVDAYLRSNPTPSPGDRVLTHAAWAERALTAADLSPAEKAHVLAWLRYLSIAALQRAGRRDEALAGFERALDAASPPYFKEAFLKSIQEHVAVPSGADPGAQPDAAALRTAIARMRTSFEKVSDRPSAWHCLAELYRLQLVALPEDASTGSRIELLQRRTDAAPFDLSAHNVDVQLRFNLADAQEQIARVESEAAAQGKVLNAQGLALKDSIVNGFNGARNYLGSQEASAVQRSASRAWARDLWSSLGLHESDGWEQRASELADAIGAALVHGEPGTPAFAAALGEELRRHPALGNFGAPAFAEAVAQLKGRVARYEPRTDSGLPSVVRDLDPLPVTAAVAQEGAEDFADWFFSRPARSTRWSAALAATLLITAGVLTGYNRAIDARRSALFPQVMTAAGNGDYTTVVDLSPQFLSRRPLNGRSYRDAAVEQAYSEALVRLFASSPGEPSPALVRAAQTYRALIGESTETQR